MLGHKKNIDENEFFYTSIQIMKMKKINDFFILYYRITFVLIYRFLNYILLFTLLYLIHCNSYQFVTFLHKLTFRGTSSLIKCYLYVHILSPSSIFFNIFFYNFECCKLLKIHKTIIFASFLFIYFFLKYHYLQLKRKSL